ncbi:MBL fold metallo-hydrolase [Lysinibacillus xylanilyticus]|uniref:MBL fold metallo-hydrolase n=1 Tax=Lysinibacillus xylanilyticus TaxID=582475 RepID=UPI002B24F7BE|nr:MBL fold metallo-hydrolase [Lysinibacillus xylanilyticus]MEB2301080.1 MBL fold metallo-hydrolase [Lysinibacillus xylanilyticus]
MLNVEILGGVGEYGRNCFFIENNGHAILLDCGVMNNRQKTPPNLTQAHVAKLDAVFISHSHTDHVGAIPLLERWGYIGPIIMSNMTAQQIKQSYQHTRTFQPESIGKWIRINPCLTFQWGYSGHLIGSVWYEIRFFEEVIFYSGDYVVDSYLLKATLPVEVGTVYDVAIIDSGHVEKRINNLEVLQQMAEYINANPDCPIIFPSSFSGKTADIATYLFQHTSRLIRVDHNLLSLFDNYYEAPENLLSTNTILQPFKLECLTKITESENTIYFVPERNETKLVELLHKKPTAIVIFTGYWNKDKYRIQFSENQHKEFFYKTHPDYHDIISLSKKMHAHKTIYFHSSLTNIEMTFLQLLKNEEEII